MQVKCVSAPLGYERFQNELGELEASPLPFLGHLFWPQSERGQITIADPTGWQFEGSFPPENPTQPSAVDPVITAARVIPNTDAPHAKRRSREKYDATAFADELELALVKVRDFVLDARRTSTTQPHLPEGISMPEARLRVVESLVLRKLTGEFEEILDMVIDDTRVMLLHKNAAYGDSALNPVRVFSKASLQEQLLVRLDDKVSRLARGSAAGEDVASDMLGCLVLVEMAEQRERTP